MKTTKKKIHKSKSKHSKKKSYRMIGGKLDNIIMENTIKLLTNNVNYLQIEGTRIIYYTTIRFNLNPSIINDLISYGLNPGLGGSIVDTSQPYIIYFFIYYYTNKVFSELFKMKDKRGVEAVDLFLLPSQSDSSSQVSKKEANRDLDLIVGETYCIFVNLSISSIVTIGSSITQIVIRFIVNSIGSPDKNGNTLSEFLITGIFMLDNPPLNVSIDAYHLDVIKKISNTSTSDKPQLYTPVTYSDEVRDKIKSIVLYSIDIEKQIISAQSSNARLHFIYLNGGTHLKFNPILNEMIEIPLHITATFLTFINKLLDTLKGNLLASKTTSESSKMTAITENYIPNVLNIYLNTPSYSTVQLNNVLLKRDMFPPYTTSSNELQINPRYDFTKMKSSFIKQYCKSKKECYLDTLYSHSEFTKFNKQNKSGKRLQTIQQVTPNVSGNIGTTISLLLPNYTLKINGEELVVTDYNWDHEWKITGPKDNLLSLQSQYLQNKPISETVNIETCYKNILEFYDNLIELFYPSMSGKDITKLYGNYLKVLSERNVLLNDVKKLVNKKTLSINTVGLSTDDINKISTIKTKSITLNEYINKFIESIFYQLIIIGNLTRKIINRIHSTCFFYFGFDSELYQYNKSMLPTDEITLSSQSMLVKLIPHILSLISTDDKKYNSIKYIDEYLSSMYYPDPNGYNTFFNSLLCGKLITEEYTSIIQSFSDVIKTVFEKLDKIAARMIEIKNDTSYETLDLSNETLSILWISDENIETVFGKFEKNVRSFIKYNLPNTYYSTHTIEKWIDTILWDMDKSDTYTYCRLFTTFVYNNIWQQFEILFSLKVLQYIFLIYQYTGKYVYYKHIPCNNNEINPEFLLFLEHPTININLFSCVVNWFKFNCMFQIQQLIKMKGNNTTITLRDIQTLFSTNELIIGSYTLMKYYITQIIVINLDVCQLTTELQSFVDILSPNESDLKNIMPQSITERLVEPTKPDNKSQTKSSEPDTKKLVYNVQVQVKVKKLTGEKLNSNNIYNFLGCKNRDLQFQLNKLKQSAGVLRGDIEGYISKQKSSLGSPNISQLKTNLELTLNKTQEKEGITSLFYSPNSIQILSSINLSENKGVDSQNSFFISVNKLVYAINVQTSKSVSQSTNVFLINKETNDMLLDIIDNQIFGRIDKLYTQN